MRWETSSARVADLEIHLTRGGSGRRLVLLHHDIGTPETLPFYDLLAEDFDVLIPHHPGFGRSEKGEWLRGVRDVAVIYQALLAQLGFRDHLLVGLGFGGWIAAEMVTMAPRDTAQLALVAPMGIKPPVGDIFDQALVQYIEYVRTGFHDQAAFDSLFGVEPAIEQVEQWDICREMIFRLAWKPYMYSQTLPHLLPETKVPSLLIWPEQDRIVPQSTIGSWSNALPGAHKSIIPSCGHFAEMERPVEIAQTIRSFFG